MVRDPKQWLLLHVEKVVLAVMLLLLVLVLAVYHPWNIQVEKKDQIRIMVEDGEDRISKGKWKKELPAPTYGQKVTDLLNVPWPDHAWEDMGAASPKLLGREVCKIVTPRDVKIDGPIRVLVPKVLPPRRVFAKAERGEVLIVFEMEEEAQRKENEGADEVYFEGLPFDHIEIERINKRTAATKVITPTDWLPAGLPARYGAPRTGANAPVRFAEPVYLFAQPRRGGEDTRRRDEERRRLEEAMARERDQERERRRRERELEDRRRRDAAKRMADDTRDLKDRVIRDRTGRPTRPARRVNRTTKTPRKTPRVTPRRKIDPADVAPGGVYYFVDRDVDAGSEYEYRIVVYCKNPAINEPGKVTATTPKILASRPVSTGRRGKIVTQKVTKWYFQGGSVGSNVQLGTFRVRCFVGGRKGLTPEEIKEIIDEFLNPRGEDVKVAGRGKDEVAGLWVEQDFQVKPGEEIGKKVRKNVDGQMRDIDFSTECCLVSVRNDVQVLEAKRKVSVPGPDGRPTTVEEIRRIVNASKLRCSYTDVNGELQMRWQKPAPRIENEPLPE